MVICAVFNCNSNSDKRLKRNSDENFRKQIKYFRFPSDKNITRIWIKKCSRKDVINIKNTCICSKHFTVEHYKRNLQHELLNYSPKNSKKLKPDADPTENLNLSLERPSGSGVVRVTDGLQENLEKLNRKKSAIAERRARQNKRHSKQLVQELIQTSSDNSFEPEQNILTPLADITVIPDPEIKFVDKSTTTDSLYVSTTASENLNLKKENLEKENLKLKKENYKLKQENDCISNIFTPGQRLKMQKQGKRIRWTVDEIAQAVAIYANGPKAYRFLLKKSYPLPSVSTLKCWTAKKKK